MNISHVAVLMDEFDHNKYLETFINQIDTWTIAWST